MSILTAYRYFFPRNWKIITMLGSASKYCGHFFITRWSKVLLILNNGMHMSLLMKYTPIPLPKCIKRGIWYLFKVSKLAPNIFENQIKYRNLIFVKAILYLSEIDRITNIRLILDYHLMLLPKLLRERIPDAKIGFFLHTPFPSKSSLC
jgi:hypothetical protein